MSFFCIADGCDHWAAFWFVKFLRYSKIFVPITQRLSCCHFVLLIARLVERSLFFGRRWLILAKTVSYTEGTQADWVTRGLRAAIFLTEDMFMKINKMAGLMTFAMSAMIMVGVSTLSAQESTGGLAPSGMTKEHHQPAYNKIRAECKSQAESQSLTGDDMKKFMKQCQKKAAAALDSGAMTKEYHQPAYSKIIAECKNKAASQSLTGDDMKKFMNECKAKSATLPSGAMDKPRE